MLEPAVLEVGKGQLSPTSGETGETFVGSATVVNGENPVEVHVFSMDGVEKQRGSSNSYVPTAVGNLTYRKEVTDDNNQSAVVGEESDAAVITQPPGPTATMSGLRFDSPRQTHLMNGGSATGDWTFSCWIKSTGQSSALGYLLADPGNTGISLKTDSNVLRWRGGGTEYQLSDAPIPKNIWTHIVVTAKDKVLQAYVNGETQGYIPTVSDSSFTSMSVGKYTDNVFDGYMSDAYLLTQSCTAHDFR